MRVPLAHAHPAPVSLLAALLPCSRERLGCSVADPVVLGHARRDAIHRTGENEFEYGLRIREASSHAQSQFPSCLLTDRLIVLVAPSQVTGPTSSTAGLEGEQPSDIARRISFGYTEHCCIAFRGHLSFGA